MNYQYNALTYVGFKWELIDNCQHEGTSRAKVPGGWIVVHWFDENGTSSESMVFVPDINHEWKINDDGITIETFKE